MVSLARLGTLAACTGAYDGPAAAGDGAAAFARRPLVVPAIAGWASYVDLVCE